MGMSSCTWSITMRSSSMVMRVSSRIVLSMLTMLKTNQTHTRSPIKQSLTYTSRLRFEKSIKSRIKTQFSKKIAA